MAANIFLLRIGNTFFPTVYDYTIMKYNAIKMCHFLHISLEIIPRVVYVCMNTLKNGITLYLRKKSIASRDGTVTSFLGRAQIYIIDQHCVFLCGSSRYLMRPVLIWGQQIYSSTKDHINSIRQ